MVAEDRAVTIRTLIKRARGYRPDASADLLMRAYNYASAKHEGQTRRSGEPYITHPLAVAGILADLEMDTDRIVNSRFDMAGAQVDVMHVPEGVSRTAIARTHWDEFRSASHAPRDWKRELDDDARANEKTFGPAPARRDPAPGRGNRRPS